MTIDGWSHEWELKQITFGGGNTSTWRTGSISRVYAASTRSIYGFSTLDTEFTSLDVCGACSRVLRVLLVALGVLYYSSYSQYSRYLGLQYSYCSYSQHAQCLGHHILEYCNTPRTSSIQSIEPRNAASTASLRKKNIEHHAYEHVPCSSIMHRHNHLQQY